MESQRASQYKELGLEVLEEHRAGPFSFPQLPPQIDCRGGIPSSSDYLYDIYASEFEDTGVPTIYPYDYVPGKTDMTNHIGGDATRAIEVSKKIETLVDASKRGVYQLGYFLGPERAQALFREVASLSYRIQMLVATKGMLSTDGLHTPEGKLIYPMEQLMNIWKDRHDETEEDVQKEVQALSDLMIIYQHNNGNFDGTRYSESYHKRAWYLIVRYGINDSRFARTLKNEKDHDEIKKGIEMFLENELEHAEIRRNTPRIEGYFVAKGVKPDSLIQHYHVPPCARLLITYNGNAGLIAIPMSRTVVENAFKGFNFDFNQHLSGETRLDPNQVYDTDPDFQQHLNQIALELQTGESILSATTDELTGKHYLLLGRNIRPEVDKALLASLKSIAHLQKQNWEPSLSS